jgi:hypothetical protein
MSASTSYCAELKRFMNFLKLEVDSASSSYTTEQLDTITPDDICRYFSWIAYGTEHPDDGSLPTKARSNTLKAKKKMFSSFMPRKNIPWDDVRREGNPTKSIAVNALIKRVMKFEVRKQGVESQARRPVEYSEFLNLLNVVRTHQRYRTADRYRLGSILTLQWHIIGRVDDMMKLQFENISFNPSLPFTLICQVTWSKNITEEREAPRQLVVGSMDEHLCVLLNLAV